MPSRSTSPSPYFDADQSLLVLTENEETYATLDDLAGKTIGVQVETTGATYAEENTPEGATIKEFQTGDEMFPALISGDIDAALQDLPVNAYRATTAPDQFVVTETFPTGEQYGFAVAKDNDGAARRRSTPRSPPSKERRHLRRRVRHSGSASEELSTPSPPRPGRRHATAPAERAASAGSTQEGAAAALGGLRR